MTLNRYRYDCQPPDFDAINRVAPGFGTALRNEAAISETDLAELAQEVAALEAAGHSTLEAMHIAGL